MVTKSSKTSRKSLTTIERVTALEARYDAIKEDIGEIKDSLKWAMRLAITQALALDAAIIMYLVNK